MSTRLLLCIAVPNIIGGLSGFLAMRGDWKEWYGNLKKAPGTPPAWVFGPAWTTLYCLKGIASFIVLKTLDSPRAPGSPSAKLALGLYAAQLLVNAAWSPVFFGEKDAKKALGISFLLLGLAGGTAWQFWRVEQTAGLLMIPYLLWLTFAGYLNTYIVLNNPADKAE